jgi:AcrR family transcriptional regulator
MSSGSDSGPVGAEGTRDRVMRIAAELFAARGYDATGVQEISEATGLGRGALYHHIKSKQDVLYHIAVQLLSRTNDRAEAIVAGPGTVEERLAALTEHLMTDLAESRDAWTTSMRDWQALNPERAREVMLLRDRYEDLWQQLLNEGADEGSLRPVDPVLRRGILGMFTSSYRWIEPTGPVSPAEIAQRYLHFILEGIRTRDGR